MMPVYWWIQFNEAEAFVWTDKNQERNLADPLHPGVLVSYYLLIRATSILFLLLCLKEFIHSTSLLH